MASKDSLQCDDAGGPNEWIFYTSRLIAILSATSSKWCIFYRVPFYGEVIVIAHSFALAQQICQLSSRNTLTFEK
jgi:hypothetical protein